MIPDLLITRCPSCGTTFRAHSEQLSARDGLVRCGQCQSVFDAFAHALASDRPAVEPSIDSSSDSFTEGGVEAGIGQAASPESVELDFGESIDAVAAEPGIVPRSPPETVRVGLSGEAEPPVAPLPPAYDFGPQVRAPGRIKPGLLFLALLLSLSLGLQATYHFRGDLALLFPAWKTSFEALCSRLGCQLPLPKRADMMSIESSDLQGDALKPGLMVLSATLRNRAPFAQTAPALELTLTDAQDQPVARRVLDAREYLGPNEQKLVLSEVEGFPAGTELPVKIYFEAAGLQPTGYRLYLFYP